MTSASTLAARFLFSGTNLNGREPCIYFRVSQNYGTLAIEPPFARHKNYENDHSNDF